ncbi:MAG: threonine dehydratase [Fischerella sp.]|nr:threonine dehydratase [Fischerella sp.]
MFSVIQIIRNSFIRLEGFLYQLFGFLKSLFSQIFGFLARIFGFSKSEYFLETNEATSIKPSNIQQPAKVEPKATPEASTTTTTLRRRPDPKMDYFRKMAQELNKK